MLRTLRGWLLRPAFARRVDLRGKRVIITGCAPGSIGYETARCLAAWGADVSITTRSNPDAVAQQLRADIADSTSSGSVDAHPLDLADRASVEAFVDWYRQRHGERLDVLVNNAGIHLDLLSQWKAPKLVDGHEIHWRTNYLGTMHLTLRLLPCLRVTGSHARIVNVVSMLHDKGSNADLPIATRPYNSWQAYGNSKLALVHASFELQRREAASGVQAYCLHPGAVYTNIAGRGLAGNPVLEGIRSFFAPVERFFLLTPEEGAQTTLHCATAADARGGQYYRNGAVAPASADSKDAAVATGMWTQTEAWLTRHP